jgi:cytidine deaminase
MDNFWHAENVSIFKRIAAGSYFLLNIDVRFELRSCSEMDNFWHAENVSIFKRIAAGSYFFI